MITSRDFEVVEFVKQFKVANTDIISETFFPSVYACRKRMKVICDNNLLKKARDSVNSQYIYYHKNPQQIKHSLLVTKFYSILNSYCKIVKFNIEPVYGDIRPDAAFVYSINGINKVGVLEVELSNKGFNWSKYERFCMNDNFKPFMTIKPNVFIVSDKVKPINSNFEYVIIDPNFSNFKIL